MNQEAYFWHLTHPELCHSADPTKKSHPNQNLSFLDGYSNSEQIGTLKNLSLLSIEK